MSIKVIDESVTYIPSFFWWNDGKITLISEWSEECPHPAMVTRKSQCASCGEEF